MAEDGQADYVNVPSKKKQRWATTAQKILFLLVGLNMLGLFSERWFIYSLYQKVEVLSLAMSACQNLSHPQESVQALTTINPVGPKAVTESSEIPSTAPPLDRTELVQQLPFAHLSGARIVSEEGNNTYVLQWISEGGENTLSNMGYNNGRLQVQKDGYYYIYSKVTVNAAKECSLITHKVIKQTIPYDFPIELMKSKSLRCPKDPGSAQDDGENLWNSFLAGIFQLYSTDEIFVTLDELVGTGHTESFLGAFMISHH